MEGYLEEEFIEALAAEPWAHVGGSKQVSRRTLEEGQHVLKHFTLHEAPEKLTSQHHISFYSGGVLPGQAFHGEQVTNEVRYIKSYVCLKSRAGQDEY
jgi:hypothetical protein